MEATAESDFDCWETARVDPAADFENPRPVRTIFGYGSLIFRPGFEHIRAYPACVKGFVRRFWQRSCDHRGTPASPGRVVALLQASDMLAMQKGTEDDQSFDLEFTVVGMAYEVAEEDWLNVIKVLDFRERHGYMRTVTCLYPVTTSKLSLAEAQPCGRAVVYCAFDPARSAANAGPETVAVTAAVIAKAHGPSGRNDEYLFALHQALQDRGVPADPYLDELVRAVREQQALADTSVWLVAAVVQTAALPDGYQEVPGYKTSYKLVQEGQEGAFLEVGDQVTVHAIGRFSPHGVAHSETGEKFWSTRDPSQEHFTYTVGSGVITGWDFGARGMKQGEIRLLRIPPEEGYGDAGFPAWGIPPGASLSFELEVTEIVKATSTPRPWQGGMMSPSRGSREHDEA